MPLANVSLQDTFTTWGVRINQLVSSINYVVDSGTFNPTLANVTITGTGTAINVVNGIIRGDGGFVSNLRSDQLSTNSISLVSNTAALNVAYSNLGRLGSTIYLTVGTLTTSNADTSVSNIASANVVNVAHRTAVAAFAKANTNLTLAQDAFARGNSAYALANNAYIAGNTGIAGAHTKANTAYDRGNTAFIHANSAFIKANSAYDNALRTDSVQSLSTTQKQTAFVNLLNTPRLLSANTTLGNTDIGRNIVVTGSTNVFLTLPNPATLVDGWYADIIVTGDNVTTLTPSSGTIGGKSSQKVRYKQKCTVLKNGSNYEVYGIDPTVKIAHNIITATSNTFDVQIPLSWRSYEINWAALNTGGPSALAIRPSTNGTTFPSTNTYNYLYHYIPSSGPVAFAASNGDFILAGYFDNSFNRKNKTTLEFNKAGSGFAIVAGATAQYYTGLAWYDIHTTGYASAGSFAGYENSTHLRIYSAANSFAVGSYFEILGVCEE